MEAMEAIAASDIGAAFPSAVGYPAPSTTTACRAALEQPEAGINGFWLILASETGEAIGDLVFLGGKPGSYSIAHQIAESQQGQGFGREAAVALVDWACNHQAVHELQAQVEKTNLRSRKILTRLEFVATERKTSYGEVWRKGCG